MGPLRGVKRDTWEGGHRVAFVARWPGKVKAGVVNGEVISHVDMLATCAEWSARGCPPTPEKTASVSCPRSGAKLDKPLREATVHHGGNGKLAIRKGNWVFIDARTGDANKEPDWFKRDTRVSAPQFPRRAL